MKKLLMLLLAGFFFISVKAQFDEEPADTSWKKKYRETNTITNDLVHTKLDIRFDYPKSYAYGKVWLTLKPHFYSTNTLQLDAKGMEINKIAMVKGAAVLPLKYEYNGKELNILLYKF